MAKLDESSPTTWMTCNRRSAATSPTAVTKLNWPKPSSPAKSSASKPAYTTLDVVPTIVSLQDHLETIRQAEIDRGARTHGHLTPEQEMAVEALTAGIINKVMHTPITTLKTAARDAEATTVIEWCGGVQSA